MITFKRKFFLFAIILGVLYSGCVDNDFDVPENTLSISDEDVITIAEVMDLLGSASSVALDESNLGETNKYVKGTIIADDASGNFFKNIVFQDATGGLSIVPDRNELNAEFPMGNTVYVKLQGLTLGYSNSLPQLGYGIVSGQIQRIPDVLVGDFVIAGGKGEEITPLVVTIPDMLANAPDYYNKLIQLEEVEFSDAFAGQPFADADNPDGPQSVNSIITDCDDNEVILRNSGFADFATQTMPFKRGSLIAVASVYNDDFQLFIRDLNDIMFDQERCDGSGGNTNVEEITIQSIQDRYYEFGADKAEPGFITGVVISDRNTGQVNGRNIFLQNGEDGILVRFTGDHAYDLGDEMKIIVSGQEVSEFNGLLQLNNIPLFNAERVGTAELPEPLEITVADLLADNNTYESTRVLIKGATLSGGSTWAGNIDVNDGTGEISIFTFNSTSFANDPVPSGTVDVIGIVSQYQEDAQLVINGPSDVSGGTVDPGGNGDQIDVSSIQDRFYNQGIGTAENGYIKGIVTSDRTANQLNSQNIFFQDGDYGIVVRFTDDHSFNEGDELEITVSGQEVSEFRGLLQVNNVPLSNAERVGSGSVTANEITIAEILADNNRHESTKVLITGATLSGGSTFAGNITVDDGTGQIPIFTFDDAEFANDAVPGGVVNVVAIVSQFDEDVQFVLNGSDDVSGGTVDPGGDNNVSTGFEDYDDDDPINKEGWETFATKGTRVWYSSSFGGERFAECEAYQDDNPETEAWLISPTIDTDEKSIFSFQSSQAYWQHQGLSVWVSADFTDLADAVWFELAEARLANESDDFFDLIDSGDIDLTDYLDGKVRVGFKYEGTAAMNTTKSRIDNVMLK